MMRKTQLKESLIMFVIISILGFGIVAMAQEEKTPEEAGPTEVKTYTDECGATWTEELAIEYFKEISSVDQTLGTDVLASELYYFGRITYELKSRTLAQMILDLPIVVEGVGEAKMYALGTIVKSDVFIEEAEKSRKILIESLTHRFKRVQIAAAHCVAVMGDWYLAEPVIVKYEYYAFLRQAHIPKAVPTLYEATRSGSLRGRIDAAFTLEKYGDSTIFLTTARSVLANCELSYTNEDDIKGMLLAIHMLAKRRDVEAVPVILRMVDSDDVRIWNQAIGALGFMAERGISDAETALYDIVESDRKVEKRSSAAEHIP